MTNRSAVLATYMEEQAADLMARFIADLGVSSAVSTSRGPGTGSYNVCVPADSSGEMAPLLDLTQVASFEDPTSAEVLTGRFVTERIPCVLDGRGLWNQIAFISGVRNSYPGPYSVYVPRRLLADAQRVIGEPAISDEELAELALRTLPGPDEQI